MTHLPRHRSTALAPAATLLALAGCDKGTNGNSTDDDLPPILVPVVAHADVRPLDTSTREVEGRFTLVPAPDMADGVSLTGDITGLEPSSFHAIAIHADGDCSSSDGSSAGPHFAPDGGRHGAPGASDAHMGDLGNLTTNAEGSVRFTHTIAGASLSGEHGLVGRAIVIRAGHDDLATPPDGDSGPRIACGVIEQGAG